MKRTREEYLNEVADHLNQNEKKYGVKYLQNKPEYIAWIGLRARCNKPSHAAYKYYGARGIKVCPEWQNSFDTFLKDMGDRPTNKHSIDRIDNSKGYSKENCKWATRTEQAKNTRHCGNFKYKNKRYTAKELADLFNITLGQFTYRSNHLKMSINEIYKWSIRNGR